MFSILKKKSNKVSSTAFSDFVNNSSSAEKKKIFKAVIKKSSESQAKIMEQACRP